MQNIIEYKTIGEQIRGLREIAGLTLKDVAKNIDIDISLLAKIERGERQPTKPQLEKIALYYSINVNELFQELLSDQIAYKILDENADLRILKVAEEKVKYLVSKR
jgi:HTH-type transcriptional regulator, competence development regulator